MSASLTKVSRRCKAPLLPLCLVLTAAGANAAAPVADGLRDCIAKARDPGAIAACEHRARSALQAHIQQLGDEIRSRLDARERQQFEHNVAAWEAFFAAEKKMLELSLGARGDGLGATLMPGAVNRLYEQREQQLREHLHNLKSAPAASG
ncbi:MAG: hypothetical protein H6953_15600 [Chromatiaceae bacterium]|nr:hypothetical protein [Gammaproteobacteria bacterium]MCP5306869.1 hypothetical protein [Chromatiaceae bacterium]MCP5316172.1 hypothetical protein [Chromatiaceae bacterium]